MPQSPDNKLFWPVAGVAAIVLCVGGYYGVQFLSGLPQNAEGTPTPSPTLPALPEVVGAGGGAEEPQATLTPEVTPVPTSIVGNAELYARMLANGTCGVIGVDYRSIFGLLMDEIEPVELTHAANNFAVLDVSTMEVHPFGQFNIGADQRVYYYNGIEYCVDKTLSVLP